jgi:FAD/FMN-containing dehydrogenase
LGALGVITRVVLQCVPAYNLRLEARPRPFEAVLSDLDRLNCEHERVRLYWFPGTETIYLMTLDPADGPLTRTYRPVEWVKNRAMRHDLMAGLMRASFRAPRLVGAINRFETWLGFMPEDRVARSDRLLNIPMPPRHQECEYAVPVERAVEALRLTRKVIEDGDFKACVPVEVRFVAADEDMLSPAYRRAVCYLGAYTYSERFAAPYFEGFEQAMKRLDGRPHWGKRHRLTPAEARAMYPEFDRFAGIRREMDPSGVFLNEYLRKLFG